MSEFANKQPALVKKKNEQLIYTNLFEKTIDALTPYQHNALRS
jgi:hypothetical protein